MAKAGGKDVLDKEHAEKMLYSGRGLPGGGQLEIRIEISAEHPDPDIRSVARRIKFFNLESWHAEWIQRDATLDFLILFGGVVEPCHKSLDC